MASVGISFAGGGLRGCAQPGWLLELVPAIFQRGHTLDYIGGTSVGALNATVLAEGETQEELFQSLYGLTSTWLAIERQGAEVIFPLSAMTLVTHMRQIALLDGKTLWNLVDGTFNKRPLDTARIARSHRQFDIFVQNKLTRRQEVFSNRDLWVQNNHSVIARSAVASASLFPFFPPVVINGVPYGDGEHINLKPAIAAGCDVIFVLLPYRKDKADDIPNDWISKNFPIVSETFLSASARMRDRDRLEIERAMEIACNIKVLHDGIQSSSRLPWRRFSMENHFAKVGFTFQGKKDPKIVPINIEKQPETLTMHSFKNGDMSGMIEDCRKQMKRILESLDFNF